MTARAADEPDGDDVSDSEHSHADEHEVFGLVMPFVVVKSKGGPLDDDAYVSGFECGRLDVRLAEAPESANRIIAMVHAVSVPQLDLLAMQHGWHMTTDATDYDEWTGVTFERPCSHLAPWVCRPDGTTACSACGASTDELEAMGG